MYLYANRVMMRLVTYLIGEIIGLIIFWDLAVLDRPR